jgi:ribosomal protein S14
VTQTMLTFEADTATARVAHLFRPGEPNETLLERFAAKVDFSDTGCWLWTATANPNGYGQLYVRDTRLGKPRARRATAVAWFLARGEWPTHGLDLCHHCDTPRCVNPDHLFLGTAKDNMRDAARKGRIVPPAPSLGVANVNAKLTPDRVVELRSRYLAGETLSELSRSFGMARSSLRWVVKRRTWRHV